MTLGKQDIRDNGAEATSRADNGRHGAGNTGHARPPPAHVVAEPDRQAGTSAIELLLMLAVRQKAARDDAVPERFDDDLTIALPAVGKGYRPPDPILRVPAGATGQIRYQGQHRGDRPAQRSALVLRRRPARLAWWIFAHAMSLRTYALASGLLLARTMNPSQFAAAAVAVIALLAIGSLDQLGFSRVIVKWNGAPSEIAPTVTTISVIFGGILYAVCYATAPALAGALGVPTVATVVQVIALRVIVRSVGATPMAMLERRSPRFVKVLVDQSGNWTAAGVTIGLAMTGHGAMSLAVGAVAGSLVTTLLSVALAPRALRAGFKMRAASLAVRTGVAPVASSVLLFAVCTADLVVIARLLPRLDLSFYLLAVCFASWPMALCSLPILSIAPGFFERFRGSPRLVGSAFLSAASILGCLIVPACLLIGGSAASLIKLAYGPGWAPAADLLRWIVVLAALRAFYSLTLDYLAARSSRLVALSYQSVCFIVLLTSAVLGAHWHGIVGVAAVQLAAFALLLLPWYLWELALSWRRGQLARRLIVRLGVAAGGGWIVFRVRHITGAAEWLDLAAGAVVTLAAMGLLVYRMRSVLHALRRAARAPRRVVPHHAAAAYALYLGPPLYPVLGHGSSDAPPRALDYDTAAPDGDDGAALGKKVRSATRWSFLNTAVLRIANFGMGVVLARMVFGPKAFGLYAVSQVILAVLLSANELGVSLAIVRWEDDVRSFARTVFTLSVASSALLYGGLLAVAPNAARVLGSPHATGMIRVLGLCVLLDGLVCVPLAMLNRAFAQRRLMLVNSVNFAVGAGVTLSLAFSGMGPISFAWGSVAGCSAALIAATIAAPFVVVPGWNTLQARKLLRFGLPLAGASLLMLGIFNVDSAIVGGTLGPTALGLYGLAFNISSWPTRSITEAVGRVSFAGFSRVAHSAELLAAAYVRTLSLLMACTVPASVMLGTLAEPIIRLVYGDRWLAAAPVLTLLAVLGLLRVAYDFSYDCLAAAGQRSVLLGIQAWWLITLIPVLLIGARTEGIVGVAAGHVLVAGPLVCPAFLWGLSRCKIRLRSIGASLWRPFVGGALMIAVCEVALHVLGRGLVGLAVAASLGLSVYLALVYPMRSLLRRQTISSIGHGEVSVT
jgi:O-antigen/teichoic acid export membrane protein